MVMSQKIAVFWDVGACSLVDTDLCFRGAYCLLHWGIITLMMEEINASETVSIYQTTQCNVVEGGHVQVR
jgi:hydrogenase maturation factor